jgi:hypothetical protein
MNSSPSLTERVQLARIRRGAAVAEHLKLSTILNSAYEVGLDELMIERLRELSRESAEATTVAMDHYNALKLELHFHKMGAMNR